MALTLARHAVLALVFELPDKQEICFYEDFEDNERQEVIYKVIHGGKHDIDVTIKNPQGVAIYKKIQERHGNFKFSTEAGKYTFCFGNKFSTVTHKTIHFVLRSQILKTQSAQLGDNTYRVNTKSEEYLEKVFQWVLRSEWQSSALAIFRNHTIRRVLWAYQHFSHHFWQTAFESVMGMGCSIISYLIILKVLSTRNQSFWFAAEHSLVDNHPSQAEWSWWKDPMQPTVTPIRKCHCFHFGDIFVTESWQLSVSPLKKI